MCFLVGNDFLPHLPALDIREGAISCLMNIYKHHLPDFGGYLTTNGNINFDRLEVICTAVAAIEDEILNRRAVKERSNGSASS